MNDIYNRRNTIFCVERESDRYPEKIAVHKGMPRKLWYMGRMPDPTARVWQSSEPEDLRLMGMPWQNFLAEHLAEAGVQIISGMAWGIDSYAHEGCAESRWRYICRAGMWCGCLLSGWTEASL